MICVKNITITHNLSIPSTKAMKTSVANYVCITMTKPGTYTLVIYIITVESIQLLVMHLAYIKSWCHLTPFNRAIPFNRATTG